MKGAIEYSRDFLKPYLFVEEVELPYEPKDGRFFFFISAYGFHNEIDKEYEKKKEELRQQFGNQNDQGLYEHVKKSLRDEIMSEERDIVRKILERKLMESKELGKTKGLFKTTIDFLQDKDNEGYEKQIETYAPKLRDVSQGLWVIDDCCSDPVCGYCDDYIFLKKIKKDINNCEEEVMTKFFNLEEAGLIKHATHHILGEDIKDNEKRRSFEHFWTFSLAKSFRDTFKELRVKNGDADIADDWMVYKGFLRLQSKHLNFEIDRS